MFLKLKKLNYITIKPKNVIIMLTRLQKNQDNKLKYRRYKLKQAHWSLMKKVCYVVKSDISHDNSNGYIVNRLQGYIIKLNYKTGDEEFIDKYTGPHSRSMTQLNLIDNECNKKYKEYKRLFQKKRTRSIARNIVKYNKYYDNLENELNNTITNVANEFNLPY